LRIAGDAVAEKRAKLKDVALRKEQQEPEKEQESGDRKVR
jgi:hypothetical protein